jgi:organic hydroperoxide reductase OsmC/OhrA
MIEHATYPVEVHWSGKKAAVAASSRDLLPELALASPPEFGGPPHVWSPEHLYVASIAACFMTTFEAIAEISQLPIRGFDVAARGELVRGEDRRYRFTRVELVPRILVDDQRDVERALRLVPKAEQACLITRSVSAEVVVVPDVTIAAIAPAEAELVSAS